MTDCIQPTKIARLNLLCVLDSEFFYNDLILQPVSDQNQPRKTRLVVCPTCRGDSVYAESNSFRPFCSARCKNADFGAWASEEFSMPADPEPDEPAPGATRLQ